MTSWLRLFAGLFVVFCLMQLGQMASVEGEVERVRRDNPPEEKKEDNVLKQLTDEFQKFINDEKTQQFIKSAADAINGLAQDAKVKLSEVTKEVSSAMQSKE